MRVGWGGWGVRARLGGKGWGARGEDGERGQTHGWQMVLYARALLQHSWGSGLG